MKHIVFILSFFTLMSVQASDEPVAVLGAEFWASPRYGESVLKQPAIRAAVHQLQQEPEAYLIIKFPDTEFGEIWGQELQAWLISLGIVSDRIELSPGYEGGEGVAILLKMPEGVEVPTEEEPQPASEDKALTPEADMGGETSGLEAGSSQSIKEDVESQ